MTVKHGTGRTMNLLKSDNSGGFVLLFILVAVLRVSLCQSFTDKKRLLEDLRARSHPAVVPLLNQSETLDVRILVTLMSVDSLDERTQVLRTKTSLSMFWTADALTWNASEYGGIKSVILPAADAWTPNVHFHNIEGHSSANLGNEVQDLVVTAGGWHWWLKGGVVDTSCQVDIKFFPFDEQVCPLLIGEVFTKAPTISLKSGSDDVVHSVFTPSNVWELKNTEIHYEKIYFLERLRVSLTLRRKWGFHVLHVLVPVVLLSLMNVLSFRLPVASGERVGYCVALFLSFLVLLAGVSDSMPRVSASSLLQIYISSQLVLGMATTAIAILLSNLCLRRAGPVPGWVTRICCLVNKPANHGDRTPNKDDDSKGSGASSVNNVDVLEICRKLDSVFFIVIFAVFIIIHITFGLFFYV